MKIVDDKTKYDALYRQMKNQEKEYLKLTKSPSKQVEDSDIMWLQSKVVHL